MKSMYFHALFLALSLAPAFAAEPITGRASVIDGDTLDIGSTRIGLHAIDAPESAQLCEDKVGKASDAGRPLPSRWPTGSTLNLSPAILGIPISTDAPSRSSERGPRI
ncbi:thermonuclease family protein [Methylobacterium sp. CM6244]